MPLILRVAVLSALIWPMVARAQDPAPIAPPRDAVVALVLTNGKLLPLAAGSRVGWHLLPWPQHESQDDRPAPPVPGAAGAIPKEWFAPLRGLPTTWRLQPISGSARVIHSDAPTRWEIATFDAIGLRTDYVDSTQKDFAFDGGVAVSGDVEPLPVSRLDGTSAEWQAIVRQLSGAFALAERRGIRPYSPSGTVPADAALAKELAKAEVDLFAVHVSSELSYYYLETFLVRPGTRASRALNCAETFGMHAGLLERRSQGPFRVKWLRGGSMTCGALTEGMEVVGAVRAARQTRLVVKYGGDDWAEYQVIDPEAPESEIRRGPWPR